MNIQSQAVPEAQCQLILSLLVAYSHSVIWKVIWDALTLTSAIAALYTYFHDSSNQVIWKAVQAFLGLGMRI